MFRVLFSLIVFLFLPGAARADTIIVPDDYATIQAAINAAAYHDTVLVKSGTYVETINFSGKAITLRSESGPEVTTIDGNRAGSVVLFENAEGIDSVLEGFTITNGTGTNTSPNEYSGGGICCLLTAPLIKENIIMANQADYGAGIACERPASPVISNNTITGNFGEGIFGGTKQITDNTITDNEVGIWCTKTDSVVFEGNIITGNTNDGIRVDDSVAVNIRNNFIAENGGDGVDISDFSSAITVWNNLVVSNSGAGVSCDDSWNVEITGNTLHDNSTAGVYCFFAEAAIANSIIWQNSAHTAAEIWLVNSSVVDISYSDVEEGQSGVWVDPGCTLNWGAGMINADPLFYRPEKHFFHLLQAPCQPGMTNPCVDTGDPSSTMVAGTTRTDGVQDSGIVDMGYHHATGASNIIYVPDDFSSIQAAINAAIEADIVIVRQGTYVENIDLLGKAITVQSESGPVSTTIDGQGAGSVVAMVSGEGPNTVLKGFTLTNGSAFSGGGIHCLNATPVIRDNIIRNNSASSHGGGIYCCGSDLTLTNNLFFDNQAGDKGGGLCCWGSSALITNATFHVNHAQEGGGIFISYASPVITNSILWYNFAPVGHEMTGGTPVVTYCDIEEAWSGTGNIDVDPLFVTGSQGGYYLSQIAAGDPRESPCVNAGDPLSNSVDGTTRRDRGKDVGVVDMGYHYPGAFCVPGDFDSIQQAIDAASDSDIVVVGPGTYFENINFLGKAIAVTSERGPWSTTIDGNQAGSVVTFENGETNSAVLQGFTLKNGSAAFGGGILCSSSAPTVRGNVLTDNKANSNGAGIYCRNLDAIVSNNVFYDNVASNRGGAICCYYCSSRITNNTMVGNSAQEGGGLYVFDGSPVVTNSIVYNNSAPTGPEIHGGSPVVTYSNTKGGWSGTGNIDQDPLFVDETTGDLHLTLDSPCRDKGDNSAVEGSEDMEGDPRNALGAVDMGADEFWYHLYSQGDVVPGGTIDVKIVGWISAPVLLALGSGILETPFSTLHGDLYLETPWSFWNVGTIPAGGVLVLPLTVPSSASPGDEFPLQALVGLWGGVNTNFTNLMSLTVE